MTKPVLALPTKSSFFLYDRFRESVGGIGRDADVIKGSLEKLILEGHDIELILTDFRRHIKARSREKVNERKTYLVKPQIDPFFLISRKTVLIQRVHDLFPITNHEWFTFK
jgi:hypothetical protein